MSRIRDIASILTSASVLSTDVETSAAITAAINALPPGYGRGNTASRPVSPTVGDIYVNTQTGFVEIYESTGWSQVGAIASTVTGVTATNSPSGRAFNNGAAAITFTPGSVLGKTYVVTSSPGSYTASGTASPITITGLQSSTQYTYTVVASNNYGTASASSASSAVTATTVPQAPTIGTATSGNAQASVTFTANATGGSAITGYTITSSPGNITASGATSPVVVTGLTNGTEYTFTAVATNANGTSAASSASNSVTPTANIPIDILLVAAGGGGAYDVGGGGGAGGVLNTNSILCVPNTLYTVSIGAGGVGAGPSNSYTPASGQNSVFSGSGITTQTAIGGGAGAVGSTGSSGGSGGGGSHRNSNGGAGTSGQGFAGGNATPSSANGAGGGGGAGGVGGSATSAAGGSVNSGAGGIGTNSYSSWATATSSGDSGYFGGGGGGGVQFATRGDGGLGGGGIGGPNNQGGSNGAANTGGGAGGAGANSSTNPGGNGGSGILLIRYSGSLTASATTGSPTRYETGGYTYYKFTGTGSITF